MLGDSEIKCIDICISKTGHKGTYNQYYTNK